MWNRVAFKLTPVSSVPHKTELYESFNAWKGVVDMIYTCNTHTQKIYIQPHTSNQYTALNTRFWIYRTLPSKFGHRAAGESFWGFTGVLDSIPKSP